MDVGEIVAVGCGKTVGEIAGRGSEVSSEDVQEAKRIASRINARTGARLVIRNFCKFRNATLMSHYDLLSRFQLEFCQREIPQGFFVHCHTQARTSGHVDGAGGIQGKSLVCNIASKISFGGRYIPGKRKAW